MAAVGTFGGQLTLVSVSDGAQGDSYSVEINHDRIYKFYLGNSDTPVFSPESVSFGLYGADKTTLLPVDSYDSELTLVGPDTKTDAGQIVENRVEQIWNLLSRLTGQTINGSGQTVTSNMLNVARTINTTTNLITFNYALLFEYTVEVGMAPPEHPDRPNTQVDVDSFNELIELIAQENSCFIINFSQSGSSLINLPVPVEFGTNEDLAKFSVNAASINAAIGNSKLEFSADGLEVTNGGLTIYSVDATAEETAAEAIFSYNPSSKSLYVKGNGEFTGRIVATEGSFTGTVITNTLTANGGTIGGFKIDKNGLYSADTESTSNAALRLLSNGTIDANNINLGTGAHINRYLQLGNNAFIWNPSQNNNNLFLEVKSNNTDLVTLNDTGILKIGDLVLNGQTSTIYGNSFSITPNLASFSNIVASGKISTVVFEQGNIQSVGGSMMFKPSYKIESYNNNVLTLDQNFNRELGADNIYVYVINGEGDSVGAYKVTGISGKNVTLENFTYNGNLVSLIDIGKANDLIVGVNSSDSANTFLRPRGITISEFKVDGTTPNPRVFLGDLDKSGIDFSETGASKTRGFGLYSENVYLTGSLTTKVASQNQEPTYAGVNTLDGTPATVFTNRPGVVNDTSAIVFWAGSAGIEPGQIQASPFQVTEKGSIYASQGIFTGAIITDSYIRGADIYAARIHGTGTSMQENYGLAFYDTTDGIVFFEGETGQSSTPQEVFSIGNSGLRKGEKYFVNISSDAIDFNGNTFNGINYYTDRTQSSYIHLYQNSIRGAHIINESDEEIDTQITFSQQGMNFGIKTNPQNMSITQNLVKMSTQSVQMDNTVLFGENLKYEKVSNGYNLFVLS